MVQLPSLPSCNEAHRMVSLLIELIAKKQHDHRAL